MKRVINLTALYAAIGAKFSYKVEGFLLTPYYCHSIMASLTERAIQMNEEIGLALKLARIARGLNQQQLAEVSGVSQSLITKIENGRVRNPRPFVRISLAKALQLPPEIFVSSDEMESEKKKEALASMLTRCGVEQRAASLIVDVIRDRSRDKVMRALSKGRKASK